MSSSTSRSPIRLRRASARAVFLLAAALAACSPGGGRPPSEQPGADGPSRESTSKEVIARLDGKPIYRDDVSPGVAFRVYELQTDIYMLLKNETEALVEKEILEREARRANVSVEELVRRNVDARVEPITEKDIDAYLKENPRDAAMGAEARPRARFYLSETRKIDRKLAYLRDLRARADYKFLLAPPEEPRTRVAVDGAPARGPADAPVTLVHYATFSSELSARSTNYVKRLEREFPGKLRLVFRHFLNPYDETGLLAAEFAIAAEEKGRFWEVHDRLFALEGKVTEADLRRVAKEIGIDPAIVASARSNAAYLGRLKADIESGLKAGVKREPVVFVNGRHYSGTFPYEKLHALVVEELKNDRDREARAR